MEDYLRIAGDGLSIAALAVIFATSMGAHKRVKDEARVPLSFDRQGEPTNRVGKMVGLWAWPVLSVVLLFLPTVTMATFTMTGEEAIMLLALRGIVSSALALRHIVVLQKVLLVLRDEGQLRS
jgi:hypothetical protein